MAKVDKPKDDKPKAYLQIKKQHPQFVAAWDAVGKATRKAGPLDDRTIQLIQLGAASALRSEGAVHSHVRRALKAGATPEEIHQALLVVAGTIGFPTVVAAFSWAQDILKKK